MSTHPYSALVSLFVTRAYHLQTSEPDQNDPLGVDSFELHSIYVPGRQVLVGFHKWRNESGGDVLNYSEMPAYLNNAQAVVEGKRAGAVISQFDLDVCTIYRIFSARRKNSRIKTTVQFDGSTDALVKILSGELRKKGLLEKVFAR